MSELDREVVGADGTKFTRAALRERVSVLEPRVLLMREVDAGTRATLDAMGEAIVELTENLGSYGLVVDLSEARGTLTADYRRYIPQFFEQLRTRSAELRHIGLVFEANPVVRIATKFLVARMTAIPFSVHKTRALALDAVRAHLG
jgi:hypothetical protein